MRPQNVRIFILRNMLLKATFPNSYLGLVEATPAAKKKWLRLRTARYIFMSVKNMASSLHYIIYNPPIGCAAPLYSPPKRCEQHQPKTGCVGLVFGKHPLIADASTTICTRPSSGAAPLFPNLDGNLCSTLTAHSEPVPFSELAETLSRQVIHISKRVFGMNIHLANCQRRGSN